MCSAEVGMEPGSAGRMGVGSRGRMWRPWEEGMTFVGMGKRGKSEGLEEMVGRGEWMEPM